ncbi:hypothetical protein HXX76_006716 [Chlamydomonas incerta]|uniref:Fucosyltransferase n=1 Tax=Chlamydomonas incerta TaxID=51695 RepID=A0A835T3K9_CHLIN|nr:hypothetical protein HXX76_006716 [Chlamydomonas incerta]|eukprot:KAG2436412.1 hypothetical protein HXX76_006716 [Chlamydomonas incerta]
MPRCVTGGAGLENASANAPAATAGSGAAAATVWRLRDSPPFESDGQQGGAWTDKSGVDFRVPLDWYGGALRALPLDPARDVLWVCSDDSQLARSGEVCGFRATSWSVAAADAAAGRSPAAAPEPGAEPRCSAARAPTPWCQLVNDHAMIADWFVMQRADVLLTSNSTFSFTAAMLSEPRGASSSGSSSNGATSGGGRGQALLLRPDPTLAAFRPFGPWDELPLLPSAPVSGNHSIRRQQPNQQRPGRVAEDATNGCD